MTSKLLNEDAATMKSNGCKPLCRTALRPRHAFAYAFGRALVAGLLFINMLSPSLAHAQPSGAPHDVCTPYSGYDNCVSESDGNSQDAVNEETANADLAAPAPPALLKYLEDQKCADITGTVSLLLDGIERAKSAGYPTPDPLLLACLAKPESKFNDGAVGRAGERGLLQVHPCHKRSMARMGLDFTDGADRVAYACVLWDASGLKPWTTRRAAQRDYLAWSDK